MRSSPSTPVAMSKIAYCSVSTESTGLESTARNCPTWAATSLLPDVTNGCSARAAPALSGANLLHGSLPPRRCQLRDVDGASSTGAYSHRILDVARRLPFFRTSLGARPCFPVSPDHRQAAHRGKNSLSQPAAQRRPGQNAKHQALHSNRGRAFRGDRLL